MRARLFVDVRDGPETLFIQTRPHLRPEANSTATVKSIVPAAFMNQAAAITFWQDEYCMPVRSL